MLTISNLRDFIAGLMFAATGLAALLIARGYEIGTARQMGAGYFPLVLGGLLTVTGLVIAGAALKSNRTPLPRLDWRPLFAITAAVVLFSQVIHVAGLVLTTAALVVVSRLARPGYAWRETLALTAMLTVLCVAVFHYGLGLQFPLWPNLG